MIAVIKYDRFPAEPGLVELREVAPGDLISTGDDIVVLGPVLTRLGVVRMVGRNPDLRRVENLLMAACTNPALVAHRGVEDREERLAFLAVVVVRPPGRLVPAGSARAADVIVRFRVVGTVVALLAQKGRVEAHVGRQLDHAPHMLAAYRWRVHAGDDRGASRGANRGTGPGQLEEHPLLCQGINIRRGGELVAIATHLGSVVFAGNPENIRMLDPLGSGRYHKQDKQNTADAHFHCSLNKLKRPV